MSSKLKPGYNTSKWHYNKIKEEAAQDTRKPKYYKLAPADDPARFTHGKGIRKHRKKKKGSRRASV